ncbi:hypothetical protein N0V90_004191 [Kalmusia sp. IMI 367209]|nr:hypothetical protein N0V90_004191 [Kalmusia sp. IMI 367209]
MNCPSRVDETVLEHPHWNQNPPYLAGDLTTCEDLNGIANARELRAGVCTAAGLLDAVERKKYGAKPPEEGEIDATMERLSYVVTEFKDPNSMIRLKRAGSTCSPNNGISESDYNTPLHVGALFIILFVSTLACSFPLLATRFPRLQLSTRFFFAVRHFGTGVLIATAFVHLLPTAFISLGNACLSSFWNEDYPAMPGAIALAGIFLVVIIEMVFHPNRGIGSVGAAMGADNGDDRVGAASSKCAKEANRAVPLRDMSDPSGHTTDSERRIGRQGTDELEPVLMSNENRTKDVPQADAEQQLATSSPFAELTPEQRLRKDIMQCVLLEVGILFHSVFIGMALSVSIGTEFIILLVAISFHQTFEGLALGSRIASIVWPRKTLQPWLMALAYGCTTPFGQALGIAIHSLYSPDSEVGLVLVGIMNAISAGLLTFASLVELLSEDFLSDESWRALRGKNRMYACLLVFFGAFFMSLVGAWA